jgi:hypothetical protein
MAEVEMTRLQYDNLLAAAKTEDEAAIKLMQVEIDAANSIIRYELTIRWTDLGGKAIPVPIPQTWSPTQTGILIKTTTIGKEDVVAYVSSRVEGVYQDIFVTRDPEGNAGWHLLDDYDFVANAS